MLEKHKNNKKSKLKNRIKQVEENRVCGISISNPDRILFLENKITKLDLAKYYENVAKKMLPYLRNRPLVVIRCHSNYLGEKFFKKHAEKSEDVYRFFADKNKNASNEFFYINTKKQLINQVRLGTCEFHIWNAKVDNLEFPDTLIFDLDPDENLEFERLVVGAKLIRKTLKDLGLKSSLKTSGGKGYHIYTKVENLTYKKLNKLAKEIALFLENKYPQIFTTNIKIKERKDKIFIDYLRNKKGATYVCPYSVRLKKNAPISFPIPWSKLDKIKPNEVTIKNYKDY